ncbi:MAG: bifunctional DNA primase/polymerase, partial [Pyrinomonadaceae bacterium]
MMYEHSEVAARARRGIHADIEGMMNLILVRIAEVSGVNCPPRVRAFYSAIQSAHGGGKIARAPFERAHLTLAQYLQFEGSDTAKMARVRRLLGQTEDYQRLAGFVLVEITRGGGEEQRKTTYADYLVPTADEAIMRARASETWKRHPGEAKMEQLDWALAQLPRVNPNPKEGQSNPLPLTEYAAQRERIFEESLEKYADGVAERDGDPDHYLQRLERLILRQRLSRQKTRQKERDAKQKERIDAAESELQRAEESYIWDDVTPTKVLPSDELVTPTKVLGLAAENPANIEKKPDMSAAAIELAGRGYRVFPGNWIKADGRCSCQKTKAATCTSPGKHPRITLWQDLATTDERMLKNWWKQWPDANPFIVTGEKSGLYVVDVDSKGGGDVALAELCERHSDAWLDTSAVRTGGGFHFYYQYPAGLDLRNTAGRLAEGIDTRGNGGYVVAPPSLHASGRRYEWMNEKAPAPPPEWLLKLLTEERPAAASKTRSEASGAAKIGAVLSEGSR